MASLQRRAVADHFGLALSIRSDAPSTTALRLSFEASSNFPVLIQSFNVGNINTMLFYIRFCGLVASFVCGMRGGQTTSLLLTENLNSETL